MRHPETSSASDTATTRHDQVVILHNVSWSQYLAAMKMRGEGGGTRISYLGGELELMSPSGLHEDAKKTLARLLEAYAEERNIELTGYGSWTLKKQALEAGVEPDECYVLGDSETGKSVPDLAIEVVATSGGIDKLEIYRRLGVREVWFWEHGKLSVFVLARSGYQQRARSSVLPELDLKLLQTLVPAKSQTQAVRTFRAALRGMRR